MMSYALIGVSIAFAAFILLGMPFGWAITRNDWGQPAPFNWRVFLGPRVYARWLWAEVD